MGINGVIVFVIASRKRIEDAWVCPVSLLSEALLALFSEPTSHLCLIF